MKLWRPVGLAEMALVWDSGMRTFPPRLPTQPFFYPVLNREYAETIARDWNAREAPFAGYVLRFEVSDDAAGRYTARTVGSAVHRELWVPSDELAAFNAAMRGPIVAERAFFGAAFDGDVPTNFGLRGKEVCAQPARLIATGAANRVDLAMEISANARAIFLNSPFWRVVDPDRLGVSAAERAGLIDDVRYVWDWAPRFAPLIDDATLVT